MTVEHQQAANVTRQGLQWQAEHSEISWTLDVQDFERALTEADEADMVSDAQDRHVHAACLPAHRGHLAGGQDRPARHRTLRDTVCVSRRHFCYTPAPSSCDTLCVGGGRAEGMSVPVGSDAKKGNREK